MGKKSQILLLFISFLQFGSFGLASAAGPQTLYDRAQAYEKIQPDSAAFYYRKITDQPNIRKSEPVIYAKSLRKAALLNDQEAYEESMAMCQQAIQLFQSLNDRKETGITYNTMANIHQRRGYFDLSIEHYLKAAALFEQVSFYKGLMICYSNIASIYQNTDQFARNLYYNRLAYQTALKEGDTFSTGMIAHDLAIALLRNDQTDSARLFALQALEAGKSTENPFLMAYANKALTEYALAKNEYQQAASYAAVYLENILQTTSDYDICLAYLKQAEVQQQLRHWPDMKSAVDQAIIYADKVRSFQLYKQAYALQRDYYYATGDFRQAYLSAQRYQQYSDSVFSEKRNNKLNELETRYQTAQKEAQIARQQVKLRQSQTRFILIAVLLLVVVTVSVLVYLYLRQRQVLLKNKIVAIEQQKQLELTKALMEGEEQERIRLAKELHDGIGGLMSMLKLQFTKLTKSYNTLQSDQEYVDAMHLLNTTMQDVRRISHALMPSALERLGLAEAVAQFCNQVQHSGKLEIDFQHYGLEERLPQKTELLVYRIIQELLNNILKYAEAREVLIQLSRTGDLLTVTVEDDGKGFDPVILQHKEGIGLQSMRQRIQLLGGQFDIESAPGKGTAVNMELPV